MSAWNRGGYAVALGLVQYARLAELLARLAQTVFGALTHLHPRAAVGRQAGARLVGLGRSDIDIVDRLSRLLLQPVTARIPLGAVAPATRKVRFRVLQHLLTQVALPTPRYLFGDFSRFRTIQSSKHTAPLLGLFLRP